MYIIYVLKKSEYLTHIKKKHIPNNKNENLL